MKNAIRSVIVLMVLLLSGAAFAVEEPAGKPQPPATQPATAAAQSKTQVEAQPAVPKKPMQTKKPRSKSLDLRHCLELENDAAIAKCAGE